MSSKAMTTHGQGTMISVESEKIAVTNLLKTRRLEKKIGHVDNESR